MLYALLADLVLILHATFIVFVVLGGLLVLWRRHLMWVHIPAAGWGILIEFKGWICPLTFLENDLRRAAGGSGYEGGVVDHYLAPLVYPEALATETRSCWARLRCWSTWPSTRWSGAGGGQEIRDESSAPGFCSESRD